MSRLATIQQVESPRAFRDYCLYGICVRSEIPLGVPEQLRRAAPDVIFSGAPRAWFEEVMAGLPTGSTPEWYERVGCPDGSDYLRFPKLFEFVVTADGRTVVFGLLEEATVESFQTYLLGHVLSYALVKQGYEPLHATTIVIDGQAIALLGASGQGKSTLAAAFLRAGYKILTDDLLLMRNVGGVLCGSPGPPRIKLFPHVARLFLPAEASVARMNPLTDKQIIGLARHQAHPDCAPVRAFVVLDESKTDDTDIRISSLSGTEPLLQLLGSTFNRRLVTPERLRRQFVAAREWSKVIPVWRLEYPRKLADIELVRDVILAQAVSSEFC